METINGDFSGHKTQSQLCPAIRCCMHDNNVLCSNRQITIPNCSQILLRSNVVDPRTAKARKEPSAAAFAEDGRSRSLAPRLSEGGLRNTKVPVAATLPVADIKVDVRGDPDSSSKNGQAGDVEMGPVDHDRSVNSRDNSPLLLQQVRNFSCSWMHLVLCWASVAMLMCHSAVSATS